MNTTLTMIAVSAGIILALIVAILVAIKHFYRVPRADQALVKTGGTEPIVSTGGGLWVIPMFHRVTTVSLVAVKIPIVRTGADALPTANKIPAEIKGELIVRVSPDDPAHVILASRSLGAYGGNHMEAIIQEQVDSLVTDALRTAAFKRTFQELNLGKKEFADEVTQLLAEDLAKLGLTLTAVTIPYLKQGEFTKDVGDVFAAEGQRNVTEAVAKNRQETNSITREAEVKIQEQDVAARKRSLSLALEQRQLEADQGRQVAEYEATQTTEQARAILLQQQARALAEATQAEQVAKAEINRDQKVKEAEIDRDRDLATQRARAAADQKKAEEEASRIKAEAEIARAKSVEAAQIEKDQAIKVADEQRLQAIAEANIVREVAVATKKAEEAKARATQALAEAEKQRAEQAIVTVETEARAEREKRVVVIKAGEEAERAKVAADRDAYVTTKKAEGLASALKIQAGAEAEARKIRAIAEFESSSKEADAKKALAEASLAEGQARAESERLIVEARNAVSNAVLFQAVAVEAIRQAPAVVREFMAPIATVSDVRVLQINGLGGGDDGTGVPGTILGAGLAASGALPLVREAVKGLMENPDVREVASVLGDAASTALREASMALRSAPSDT